MALKFSLSTNPSVTAGPFTFGFSPECDLEMRCYRRFQRGPGGFPLFRTALAAAAASLVLPKETKDLDALQADTVLVLRGTGKLTVSAGVSMALGTESLASVSLVGNQKFEATAGASVGVDADLTVTGAYQVRLRRLDGHRAELGVYTLKSREEALSVSAEIGVSAKLGKFDLGEKIIGALSPKPAVDLEEFKNALQGENDDQKDQRIAAFQASIQAGICTKLQLSACAAFGALQSHEAAWVFEIDTDLAATDEARAAVANAFAGRLDALTRDPRTLPAGIIQERNVLTDTEFHKQTLKINVLGLVNLISAGKLAQLTTVQCNANGDITLITDTSSESRMSALLLVFGGDGKRLHKLLSENFLITAVYHARDLGVLPPEFKAKHTYFDIQAKTSREEMRNRLDVARVLGLFSAGDEEEWLGNRSAFGRTTVFAEMQYSSDAVRGAFLEPALKPPSEDGYDTIGRSALAELLSGDAGQEYRKRVASDDALWLELRQDGNRANFPHIFGLPAGALNPGLEAAGADFTVITDWAAAMTAAGKALQDVDALLGASSTAASAPDFEKARTLLKQRLGQVVKNTKDEFGEPLGMMMFYFAANRDAMRQARITGPEIPSLDLGPASEIVAKASG
jgi:hypothetical protein